MLREIVLDTETTGLDPRSGHRLVEIGCVELINHFPSGKTWHHYINPQRDMPDEAFRVHGISGEFLKDKPIFDALADDFAAFIEDARLVIHNASFDVGFLNHELESVGRAQISWDHVLDTLALARRKFPGGPNSLDALCRRFHIDNSARTKHGALLDSELLAEVYIELIGGHQAKLDLNALKEGPDTRQGAQTSLPARPKPLASRLTGEEIAAHGELVGSLGDDAVWQRYDRSK